MQTPHLLIWLNIGVAVLNGLMALWTLLRVERPPRWQAAFAYLWTAGYALVVTSLLTQMP